MKKKAAAAIVGELKLYFFQSFPSNHLVNNDNKINQSTFSYHLRNKKFYLSTEFHFIMWREKKINRHRKMGQTIMENKHFKIS